jgi:predicted transcriptional regulator
MAAGEKTTTIRMDTRTLKRVDGLARMMSRSRSWIIKQAIDRYLDYEEWFVREVNQGLREVEAGDVIDHESVVRKWERKRETSMVTRRQPRPGIN